MKAKRDFGALKYHPKNKQKIFDRINWRGKDGSS